MKMLLICDVPVNFQYYPSSYCLLGLLEAISEPLGSLDLSLYIQKHHQWGQPAKA